MLARIHSLFLPNKTVVCLDPRGKAGLPTPSLLTGKTQVDGNLTAFVCHNFTCSLPVTDWGALKELLEA
jgi:uncharacterized protein YyaL (SSP411 family)